MNIGDKQVPNSNPNLSDGSMRNSVPVSSSHSRTLRVDELFGGAVDESSVFEPDPTGTNTSGVIEPLPVGLSVIGCSPSCGKTILMMGLAGVLSEENLKVRCLKPITLGPPLRVKPEHIFISSMGGAQSEFVATNLQFPPVLSMEQWEQIVSHATMGDSFNLVELPGSAGTPVSIFRDGAEVFSYDWKSSADLAAEIKFPVVLVARHSADALEQIDLNCTYLQSRNLNVIAIATVETSWDDARFMEKYLTLNDFEMLIKERTRVPYLGCLPFSSSLSGLRPNQATLSQTTADSMDMLLIRRNVALPI